MVAGGKLIAIVARLRSMMTLLVPSPAGLARSQASGEAKSSLNVTRPSPGMGMTVGLGSMVAEMVAVGVAGNQSMVALGVNVDSVSGTAARLRGVCSCAERPEQAKGYFPSQFWERLATDKHRLMLEGSGEMLLFWSMPGGDKESRRVNWVGNREAVRLRMDIAERLFGWMRECDKVAQKGQARDLSGVLNGISAIQAERDHSA